MNLIGTIPVRPNYHHLHHLLTAVFSSTKGDCACLDKHKQIGTCDDAHPDRWCVNCTDSMGSGCEYLCVHGTETPAFSVQCVCEPCYDDKNCLLLCGGHGSCRANGTCQCEEGYKGDYCRELDCPGNTFSHLTLVLWNKLRCHAHF